MNDIYFNDILGIGDLYLEKVFSIFEDENIIFVCKDSKENRYLCICYEMRYCLKWVLCRVSNQILLDLIYKKITIKSVFDNQKSLIQVLFDGDVETSVEWEVDKFDNNLLPDENAYLKSDVDLEEYILKLDNDLSISKFEGKKIMIPNDYGATFEDVFRINMNHVQSKIDFPADIQSECGEEYVIQWDKLCSIISIAA